MQLNAEQKFLTTMESYLDMSSKRLPDDVMKRLHEMRDAEESELQRTIYDTYFENFQQAISLNRPCCQDTGLLHFYVRVGANFPFLNELEGWLRTAVHNATLNIPLRPNTVNFFEEHITDDGLGERIPWIQWTILPGRDDVEILSYFAGGGCCLPGQVKVFPPSQGYAAIGDFVFEVVTGLGLNACPPVIIGVGLGENIENAAMMSKLAYLRPIGTHHHTEKGAALEKMLLEGVNKLGMGAQGLRGKEYALAVHVESSARHTATFAVAVNLACYVHRRGIIRFDRSLNYTLEGFEGVML